MFKSQPNNWSRSVCGIFLTLTFLFCSPAWGQKSADWDTSLDRLVGQIAAEFPGLEGFVLAVDGDTVTLDLKRGQPVLAGDTLKLIRYGEEITHPVTGKTVGRQETDLGEVEIMEVRRDYSLARVVSASKQPRKGDGVQSRFRKIKILVAPVRNRAKQQINADALGLDIESRFNRHPKFEVPSFDLRLWMLENGVNTKTLGQVQQLSRLNARIPVDYLLSPEIQSVKNKPALAYKLIDVKSGIVLKEARVLTADLPRAASRSQREFDGKETQTNLKRRKKGLVRFVAKQEFDFELVDMAAGDLNGDGKKEFVLIDDHRVMVYRYQKKQFRKIGQKNFRDQINKFLSVDVADINGNGRDEIFITNQLGDTLSSMVLEIVPGRKNLVQIQDDLNFYMRVIQSPGRPDQLIAQRPDMDRPFQPGIFNVKYRNKEYLLDKQVELPPIRGRDFLVYGLTFGNVDSHKTPEIIMLDKDYKLRVYSARGRLLLRTDEYFGHDPRLIDVAIRDEVPGTFIDHPDDPQPVSMRGRLSLLLHRGEKYLVLPRNHRFGGSLMAQRVIVNNCSLVFLGLNPEGFQKEYETNKQKGYLAGYVILDGPDAQLKQVHMAAASDKGGLLKGERITTIYTYNW